MPHSIDWFYAPYKGANTSNKKNEQVLLCHSMSNKNPFRGWSLLLIDIELGFCPTFMDIWCVFVLTSCQFGIFSIVIIACSSIIRETVQSLQFISVIVCVQRLLNFNMMDQINILVTTRRKPRRWLINTLHLIRGQVDLLVTQVSSWVNSTILDQKSFEVLFWQSPTCGLLAEHLSRGCQYFLKMSERSAYEMGCQN